MRHKPYRLNNRRWALLVCLVALGTTGLGLILTGCSDNGLVTNNDSSEEYVSFFDQPYYPDALAKRTDIAEASFRYVESKLLAQDGGVIPLSEDGEAETFVVLPGSFVADTMFTVTVTRLVTDDGETPVVMDFGPDGLQFSRPAVVRVNVRELFGRSVKTMLFYWLNEETNLWELQETCPVDEQGYMYASVEHFSKLAYTKTGVVPPGTDAN